MTVSNQARGNGTLTFRINRFAEQLLNSVEGETASIDQKITVFNSVTKWIAIKNKINDELNPEGAHINDIRKRLASGEGDPIGRKGNRPKHPKRFVSPFTQAKSERHGIDPADTDGTGGEALESLKSRIPRTDDGDHERGGDDRGGEDDLIFGRPGRFLAGLPSGDGGDDRGPDRSGDV